MSKPVVRFRYKKNVTRAGRPTATKAIQGMFYYTYGAPAEKQGDLERGQWYRPDGQTEDYANALAWVETEAVATPYTYQIVLSLRDGLMQPQDFITALNQTHERLSTFSDYRLIVHYDSEHVHAHVTAFREKTVSKKELTAFSNEVKPLLAEMEQQRLTQEQAEPNEQERALGLARVIPDLDIDYGL